MGAVENGTNDIFKGKDPFEDEGAPDDDDLFI